MKLFQLKLMTKVKKTYSQEDVTYILLMHLDYLQLELQQQILANG